MAESFPSDHLGKHTDRVADRANEQMARLVRSPGWYVGFGVLTVLAGLVVVIWPGITVLGLAVVLGFWLFVAGLFRLIEAVTFDESRASSRALMALLGVVAILAGILVLARPLQTAVAVALLLGAFWVIAGIIELFHGFSGAAPQRLWTIVGGLLSIVAGVVVLVYPGTSLVVLSWLFGVVLILLGAVSIATGLTSGNAMRAGSGG